VDIREILRLLEVFIADFHRRLNRQLQAGQLRRGRNGERNRGETERAASCAAVNPCGVCCWGGGNWYVLLTPGGVRMLMCVDSGYISGRMYVYLPLLFESKPGEKRCRRSYGWRWAWTRHGVEREVKMRWGGGDWGSLSEAMLMNDG